MPHVVAELYFLFGTKASAAAEAVLDRDAFLDKPFFLVHDHWTHQQMLDDNDNGGS